MRCLAIELSNPILRKLACRNRALSRQSGEAFPNSWIPLVTSPPSDAGRLLAIAAVSPLAFLIGKPIICIVTVLALLSAVLVVHQRWRKFMNSRLNGEQRRLRDRQRTEFAPVTPRNFRRLKPVVCRSRGTSGSVDSQCNHSGPNPVDDGLGPTGCDAPHVRPVKNLSGKQSGYLLGRRFGRRDGKLWTDAAHWHPDASSEILRTGPNRSD